MKRFAELFPLVCLLTFTMCAEKIEKTVTVDRIIYPETPVQVMLMDEFGNNVLKSSRVSISATDADGVESPIEYGVLGHGDSLYVSYNPPHPVIGSDTECGDMFFSKSIISVCGQDAEVTSEFVVAQKKVAAEKNGTETFVTVEHTGDRINDRIVDKSTMALAFTDNDKGVWVAGDNGDITLRMIFTNKTTSNPEDVDCSVTAQAIGLSPVVTKKDISVDKSRNALVLDLAVRVRDYYRAGGVLVNPQTLNLYITGQQLFGDANAHHLTLAWNGNCAFPQFVTAGIDGLPSKISIRRSADGTEYVEYEF